MRETLWKLPDHAFVKETVFRLAKEDPDVRAFSPGRSALGRERSKSGWRKREKG